MRRYAIAAPLIAQDRCFGVLTVATPGERMKAGTAAGVQLIAQQVGTALEAALLRDAVADTQRRHEEVMKLAAHELRGALAVISLASETLSRAAPASDRRSSGRHLDAIRRNSARLAAVVGHLTETLPHNGEGIALHIATHRVADILKRVVDDAALYAAEKTVRVRIERGGPRDWECDGEALRRAIGALLLDAIKRSPVAATVSLSSTSIAEGLRLCVSDVGPNDGALSLGGLVARVLVERHGGALSCEHPAAGGTAMTALLPRRSDLSAPLSR